MRGCLSRCGAAAWRAGSHCAKDVNELEDEDSDGEAAAKGEPRWVAHVSGRYALP